MQTKLWRNIVSGSVLAAVLGIAPSISEALETTLTAAGAPEELVDRLTTASLSMSAEQQGLDTAQELLAAALSDYKTLVQVLYDQGYFSPVVHIRVDGREAASIPPLNPPSTVNSIDITVATGPLFTFGQADVTPLASGTELPEEFRQGETATTGAIRDAARAGVIGWFNQGHALADVSTQKITADHRASVINAKLQLAPGPQLRFGSLRVPDTSDVRPTAIARIAGFPTGEIIHPDKVQTVATRLRRTGAFSSVAIRQADTANPDGTLNYRIEVIDSPPRKISFGAEISSDQGIEISGKWIHRNLWGGAERFQIEARIRNIGSDQDIDGELAFRLDRPGVLGPDGDMFYLGSIERLDQTYYTANVAYLAVGARRIFSDKLYAEIAIAPNYNDVDDAFGQRKFRLISLPGRVELDHRDNKIDTHKGYYLDTRLTPFIGLSGSQSGVSLLLDGRGYVPLAGDRFVLAGRIQLGSIGGASLQDITPQYLFYSGGADTVRGQPYQSLGVPVGTETAGGRALLAISAEVRTKVTKNISVVGFFDFGAVDAGSFVNDSSPHHSGAGLGLRYDVAGIGPIRFDVAAPVSGTTGDGVQFYIGIGQAF